MSPAEARFLAARVVAVRSELSETQKLADLGVGWAALAVRALKGDLFRLETRLATAMGGAR